MSEEGSNVEVLDHPTVEQVQEKSPREMAGEWMQAAADYYRKEERAAYKGLEADNSESKHYMEEAVAYERALGKLSDPVEDENLVEFEMFIAQCAVANKEFQEDSEHDARMSIQVKDLKPPKFLLPKPA